ncbi:MAG: DUF4286 family protein [Segetibacter sp.]|jgi:hypothetical protein|nr:DUF4286 family protein [Segetibacter sp.]
MMIYNVTMKVDWTIAEEWLQWMQEIYIREIISTGCFEKYQFVQLLQVDDTEGPTFAAQYYARTLGNYNHYLQNHASDFNDVIGKKWGDKCIAFGTLMKVM